MVLAPGVKRQRRIPPRVPRSVRFGGGGITETGAVVTGTAAVKGEATTRFLSGGGSVTIPAGTSAAETQRLVAAAESKSEAVRVRESLERAAERRAEVTKRDVRVRLRAAPPPVTPSAQPPTALRPGPLAVTVTGPEEQVVQVEVTKGGLQRAVIEEKPLKRREDELGGFAGFERRFAKKTTGRFLGETKQLEPLIAESEVRLFKAEKELKQVEAAPDGVIAPSGVRILPLKAGLKRAKLKTQIAVEKFVGFQLGAEKGIRKGVREKPITTGLTFAAFAVLPAGVSGVKLAAAKAGISVPAKVSAVVGTAVKVGLPAFFGVTKGVQIAVQPTVARKGEVVGVSLATEVAPALGGLAVGRRLAVPIEFKAQFAQQLKKLPKGVQQEFAVAQKELAAAPVAQAKVFSLPVERVQRLTPREAAIVKRVIIQRRGQLVVTGTLAQQAQLPPSQLGKIKGPVDIDLKSDLPGIVGKFAGSLRRAGLKPKVAGPRIFFGSGKAIEFGKITVGKKPLAGTLATVKSPFTPFGAAFVKTPEGVRVTKLGLQLQRKLFGGFEAGAARRSKDIPSLKEAIGALALGKKGQLRLGVPPSPTEIVRVSPPRPQPKPKPGPRVRKPSPVFKPSAPSIAPRPFKPSLAPILKPSRVAIIPRPSIPTFFRPSRVTPPRPSRAPAITPPSRGPILGPPLKPPITPPLIPPSRPPLTPPSKPPAIVPPSRPPISPPGIPPFIPTIFISQRGPPFVPPFLPDFGLGVLGKGISKFKPPRQAFTPGFVSLVFGVRKKLKKRRGFTGLEARPIPLMGGDFTL